MDITERKRTERARELNLRVIVDSISAPVALMRPSAISKA